MKKKLVASLAAAMVLSVAGTSFAATNPFVDVPAKHWAYASVTQLAQAGIVDGYGDGTFRGDKVMSRYEMAQIVAKAMARSDKADAAQKAMIDKLSVEFASELEGLNVRVNKLEKNASSIKVTGEARIRFNDTDADDVSLEIHKHTWNGIKYKTLNFAGPSNDLKLRTRVHLNGNINEDWTYYGRLQAEHDLRGGGDNTVTLDNAWVKGPILGATTTIGRFDYYANDGLMIDSTLNGVNFAFGNVLKANIFYGKDNNQDVWGANKVHSLVDSITDFYGWPAYRPIANNHVEVTGATMSYGVSKNTNITGGYYQFKDKSNTYAFGFDDNIKVWEAGFNSKLNDDWAVKASYGKSDVDVENKAYYAQLNYKGADKDKVHSYGAWVNYRHLERFASPKATFDSAYTSAGQIFGGGAKGYEVGFNYTPMLNTVVAVKYVDVKPTSDFLRIDNPTKFFQAQAEFFF